MMTEESLLTELTESYSAANDVNNSLNSAVMSDDNEKPIETSKKQIALQMFSDSESDIDKENVVTDGSTVSSNNPKDAYNEINKVVSRKRLTKRLRIKNLSNSDSDNNSSSEGVHNNITENSIGHKNYESLRTEDKKKKLKEKFKKLIVPHSKSAQLEIEKLHDSNSKSENSEDEISCLKIKQKIKKSTHSMKSICDPDTSDEDDNREGTSFKKKYKSKTVKPTSPKPMRMSTKQAMENMQKIKSESNRMLREKEVSLPYHRPKALSLKDILSRRKPAITSDGKALPIKMNNEQLKQYALMLEQRQKEVIELCKSDTEDDEIPDNDDNIKIDSNSIANHPLVENDTNNMTLCENDSPEEKTVGKENETKDAEKESMDSKNEIGDNEKETKDAEKESMESKNEIGDNEKETMDTGKETENEKKETMDKAKITAYEVKDVVYEDTLLDKEKLDLNEKREQVEEKIEKPDEEKIGVDDKKEINQTTPLHNVHETDVHMDSISIYEAEELPKEVPHSNKENESQLLVLQYYSEIHSIQNKDNEIANYINDDNEFTDNDYSFDEITKIIEDAEGNNDVSKIERLNETTNSTVHTNPTPKLIGGPGTFIDLDDDPTPRKLNGVELLKERFKYFADLKSSEDKERDREQKYKPGTQHMKLRHELEIKIAEQRSLEWEKRLEEESKLKSEMAETETLSDDDIEKLEAKLEEVEDEQEVSSEGEEEPIENDVILEDKPKKRNPMVDDEAEVSEDEEIANDFPNDEENEASDDMDVESSESSSEDEEEPKENKKTRKGRIIKAFEDSDDESNKNNVPINHEKLVDNDEITISSQPEASQTPNYVIKDSQDDELQLAQPNRSSEDLFSTQESDPNLKVESSNKNIHDNNSADLGTRPSSISSVGPNLLNVEFISPDKNVCGTEPRDSNTGTPEQEIGDDVAALCTGKFYDNLFMSKEAHNKDDEKTVENMSQDIGDDVAALCTGKFYDNPFVSQNETKSETENSNKFEYDVINNSENNLPTNKKLNNNAEVIKENTILKSILDELDEPETPKQNKYFVSSKDMENNQFKKKFVIDSDDETNGDTLMKKQKKLKKRKAEDRALQISEDEEDEFEEEQDDYESEIEEDEDRVVEYDSEENEVEIQQKPKKKKRLGEFFENEAELSSEDEWVGSGDEDERGLDLMEREEGDDDKFHQGQLQRELGQIHMREVLDQDKREVRLIQELLFEDGDLGDGHRQRKFRWRNADGETETGTNPDEFGDTQEEEFESEEQWRKQRHEREMFLRQMQEDNEDPLNSTINRTTIIKANLNARSMSTLITENKTNKTENEIKVPEKKTSKDIPSPEKPFTIFQQNYHNSLLTRGRGALARLAALATPLATDDNSTSLAAGNGRNFVFAVKDREPKVTKRKAESNLNTPRLIKKMKTEETIKHLKSSLLDHFKT